MRSWIAIALVGCGGGTATPRTVAEPAATLDGAYWCVIEDHAISYPPYPCTIQHVEQRIVLAKLGGSQRFEGDLVPRGAQLAFSGLFFCPLGSCTQPLHGTFAPSEGGLVGTFRDSSIVVRMIAVQLGPTDHDPTLYGYGGASYGGASYGGASYGGASYGGASYGGALQL